MGSRKRLQTRPLDGLFVGDRRDRHPGTHFVTELGAPPSRRRTRRHDPLDDPHVDEDLGCSAFGIDLLIVGR